MPPIVDSVNKSSSNRYDPIYFPLKLGRLIIRKTEVNNCQLSFLLTNNTNFNYEIHKLNL